MKRPPMKLGLAFLALLAAGLASSQDPAGRVVLGSGDHAFEWVRGWAQLPNGGPLGYTHGCVLVDSRGRVYVNTDTERAVTVFDADGSFVGAWGKELAGGLHGMALVVEDDEEFLYLTHLARGEVLKATLEGEILWRMGYPEESGKYPDGTRYHPTSVAVAPDGHIYVADGYGRHWIHRYDAERNYLGSFGGPDELRCPHGIWLQPSDGGHVLIVADRENRRLKRYDLEGRPLEGEVPDLRRPCHTHGRDDELVVAELEGRVTLLDAEGEVLARLGANSVPEGRARKDVPPEEWKDGVFVSPHCACFDAEGDIYVVDWLDDGRLTKLKRIP